MYSTNITKYRTIRKVKRSGTIVGLWPLICLLKLNGNANSNRYARVRHLVLTAGRKYQHQNTYREETMTEEKAIVTLRNIIK